MNKQNVCPIQYLTGFIGVHTSISLLERGFRVVIIDSLVNTSRKGLDRLRNKDYLGMSILNSQLKLQ